MDAKQALHRYLAKQRDALLAKLDGFSERDVRWPMTQTGTNLLGLVKHGGGRELRGGQRRCASARRRGEGFVSAVAG